MKKLLLLSLTVSMALTGCQSTQEYYEEHPDQDKVATTTKPQSQLIDTLFTVETVYGIQSFEEEKNNVFSEGGYSQLNESELDSQGVDTSALSERVIPFTFDSYALSSSAKKKIDGHIDLLKSAVDVKVVLEGHTDIRGDRGYNLKLGEKRALAVKDYMMSRGIGSERVEVITYGEEKLLNFGKTDADHASNRRAEFVYN